MPYKQPDFDPETQYVAWNGDIRDKPTRWNGDSDMEDQGFMSRGVTSVSVPPRTEEEDAKDRKVFMASRGACKPTPEGHVYSPYSRPPKPTAEDPKITKANRAKR